MKKNIIRIILLLFYCVPFVFLAMNEDVVRGTLWFCLLMIIGFGALCYRSIKTKNSWIVIVGNVLSFVSTCIFTLVFQTEKWGWYFKPFTPYQAIIFESILALGIQMIFVICNKQKYKRTEDDKI